MKYEAASAVESTLSGDFLGKSQLIPGLRNTPFLPKVRDQGIPQCNIELFESR